MPMDMDDRKPLADDFEQAWLPHDECKFIKEMLNISGNRTSVYLL